MKYCNKCGVELTDNNWYTCYKTNNQYVCKKCEYIRIEKCRHTVKGRYYKYKSDAKSRSLKFNLTLFEFKALVLQPCHYCGKEPKNMNGVDRVNNEIGYEPYNCVPCCAQCNRMKSNYNKEKFKEQCQRIVDNMKEKEVNLKEMI